MGRVAIRLCTDAKHEGSDHSGVRRRVLDGYPVDKINDYGFVRSPAIRLLLEGIS